MSVFYKDGFFNNEFGVLIPDNAVEISDDEYLALLNGQSTGKKIVPDINGKPMLAEPQPSLNHEWNGKAWVIPSEKQFLLLSESRERFVSNIDERAAAIYSTWTRFESEYRERQSAAEDYKSQSYEGECSRYISDFAKRAGLDYKSATNLILLQASGLEKLQVELANQRMRKYELKKPNLTLEQMQSIYDDIIKQMDNLMEAYKNG